jgi:aminocarboxymuconate-semialdehyde decarboxylase
MRCGGNRLYLTRRDFLSLGSCAAAVAPLRSRRVAAAQFRPSSAEINAIDIHAHYFPMEYLKSIANKGGPEGFNVDLTTSPGPTLTGGGAVTVLDPTYWDLERRVHAMDAAGIKVHALSLTMPMPHLAPPDRGAELAAIYNDAVVAAHRRFPDRFVGCVSLPLKSAALAVKELDRVGKQNAMRAVYFPTNIGGKELSDPSLDPIYDKIQSLNLPIMLHPHPPVVGLSRLQKFYLPNLLGNPFDTTVAVAYLVFGGVMDRFPNLDVLLPHAGGAFPYLYGRVQRGQEVIPDLKNAAKAPVAAYLKRFYYDTISHSAEALKYLVDLAGVDRVMLGSDYCFNMGYERPREIVTKLSMSAGDRDRIFFGNARRLLKLA